MKWSAKQSCLVLNKIMVERLVIPKGILGLLNFWHQTLHTSGGT